jgi:predicted CopG family antitoxin
MTVKNISITEEAYKALQREKKGNESFTETILRLTHRSGRLEDCFGTWEVTDEEQKRMDRELSKGWKKSTERLRRLEMS